MMSAKKKEILRKLLDLEPAIKDYFGNLGTDLAEQERWLASDWYEVKEYFSNASTGQQKMPLARVLRYFYLSLYRNVDLIEMVLRLPQSSKILDIGPAYGFYDIVLARDYGMDVTGMELPEWIPVRCGLCAEAGVKIIPGRIGRDGLSLPDESYDVVIMSEVIEHLRVSPLKVIEEICRVLTPNGYLLLGTPNIARLANILKLVRGKNIMEPFVDDDSKLDYITDTWMHLREYTMGDLEELLAKGGFLIEHKRYSWGVDRYNEYWPQRQSRWTKIVELSTSVLTKILPRYRTILMILAKKKSGSKEEAHPGS